MKRQDGYYVESREISIKRMLWWILRKWRVGVIFAVVCAVAFGAWQFRKEKQEHLEEYEAAVAAQNQEAETVESLSEQLTSAQISGVERVVDYWYRLKEADNYLNNSILMQLNPYAEDVVYIYIPCVSMESAASVANDLASENFMEELVEAISWSAGESYLRELISVDVTESDVKVTVKAESAENAEAAADGIIGLLEDWGVETTEPIYKKSDVVIDLDAVEKYNSVYESYDTNQTLYNTYYKTLTSTQVQLFKLLLAGGTSSSTETEAEEIILEKTTLNFRMILLGFMAGIIAAAVILGAVYTLSGKVHGEAEAKSLFQEPVVGVINAGRWKRKRLFSFVDRAVYKLGNRGARHLNYDGQLALIAANIALACQARGAKEIYLSGSEYKKLPEELVCNIKELLQDEHICAYTGDSILYHAGSLKEAAEKKYVVFLEISEGSVCTEIAKELNLCMQNEISCMGLIMVE